MVILAVSKVLNISKLQRSMHMLHIDMKAAVQN